MTTKRFKIGNVEVGGGGPMLVIAGPCVIESSAIVDETAAGLKEICARLGLPLVFKSSYDKANRTSLDSFRGPGMDDGLRVLAHVKATYGLPIITDVHEPDHASVVAEVADALQIPAFLCRQTDLITACAITDKPVNIKKGQFLSPWDMPNVIRKFVASGGERLMLTERGTAFGYNNLVVDFRGLPVMRSYGYPVIFDLTHSLQLPGGQGTSSGGQREFAAPMLRAAAAVGIDGVFMEVHPDPNKALCDGPNMVALRDVEAMLRTAIAVAEAARG
jgi:2-dehydro-3-deoxyphosphooctonate aldolase (KDO 8-P synthase)